jgi:hypothetical protein
MSHQDPDDRPLLERPVRSLLDVSIGTALKAYALWVIGGFVIAAIVALVLFGALSTGGGDSVGTGSGGAVIATGTGKAVTLAQYRAVTPGTAKSVVVARLGRPATTDDPTQSPTPKELRDDCIGYDRAGRSDELFFFCFSGGKLVRKHAI